MEEDSIIVRKALPEDCCFAGTIAEEMDRSAKARGSGISKRSPENICRKIREGKAIIALTSSNNWVGFSYIEVWGNGEFVSNSGLIVDPLYRKQGVASRIKQQIFDLSRERYPDACLFSITTGFAIMKMNAKLGFEAVTFNEITHDKTFWEGCKSCVNYTILEGKQFKHCLCTAMLYTPENNAVPDETNVI